MVSDQYLIWLDLEMTGLNPAHDLILEIATIITDNQLTQIAQGPTFVINQPEASLTTMSEWCTKQHTKSGLIEAVRQSTVSVAQAEEETLQFLATYCKPRTAPLCGNSIYQDRIFLAKYMPKIASFAHYRLIDISSVKELVRRWYPKYPATEFKKKESHRALQDIEESIAELQQYQKNFFITKQPS